MKTQVHIADTQKTRNRALYDRINIKLSAAVSTYRLARAAVATLAPNEEFGRWKEQLQELQKTDVRGPGQEEPERSTSRYIQSWIWTSAPHPSTSPSVEDPDLHAALRTEWCKAQERASRYEEEVELVIEEMRRTLAFFQWIAKEWDLRATSLPFGDSALDITTVAGIAAYAHKQASTYRRMVSIFVNDWYPLLEQTSGNLSWLKEYPRPQHTKRHRLISNVQLYHSGSFAQYNSSETDEVATDDLDSAPHNATTRLEDLLESTF